MESRLVAAKRSGFILPKAALLTLSALLLLLANFKIGFAITVGGWESQGVYSPKALLGSVEATEAAASELLGEQVNLRGAFSVRLKVISGEYTKDTRSLERALMDNTPGIARLCAVKVDGVTVGWVSELSELGEILESLLTAESDPYTVSAGFEQSISAEYSYAPEAVSMSAMEVSATIRGISDISVINAKPNDAVAVSGDNTVYENGIEAG